MAAGDRHAPGVGEVRMLIRKRLQGGGAVLGQTRVTLHTERVSLSYSSTAMMKHCDESSL